MELSEKAQRIVNIVLKALTWLLVAFAVCMMVFTIFTVSTVDRNDRSIFGLRFYIVQTGSMSKSEKNEHLDVHFNAGDIILIKEVEDKTALQSGDIISFISTNDESYGETITHMIYERKEDDGGRLLGYVTYGTNTGAIDEALVEPGFVIGTYAGKLPGLGNFFAFVKSTPGYIVCILVPFLLLILYNGINVIRLFRKYKQEQSAILQAEKDEIAAERKHNEEMLKQLQEMQAAQTANAAPAPPQQQELDALAEQRRQNEEMLKQLLELKAQLAQQAAAANPTQPTSEQPQTIQPHIEQAQQESDEQTSDENQ
ncbi:MAG: hypothetical protein E7350_04875 [Clostridiales bacterium]|nr:hypothetical protein [Clostridiales bacterium]